MLSRGREIFKDIFQQFKKSNRKLILDHLKGYNYDELSHIVSESLQNISEDLNWFIFNNFTWYNNYPDMIKSKFTKKF